MIACVARLTMRSVVHIYFSPVNFAEQYQKLEKSVVAGNINVLYGVEYLSSEDILTLKNLSFALWQNEGYLRTLCDCT